MKVSEWVNNYVRMSDNALPMQKKWLALMILLFFLPISFLYIWVETNSNFYDFFNDYYFIHKHHVSFFGTRASVYYEMKSIVSSDNAFFCRNRLIHHIKHDPCYDINHQKDIFDCVCSRYPASNLSNQVTYQIPEVRENAKPLTEKQLKDETIFAFIHVNKAAGSTIKKNVLYEANAINKWNGIGIGTYRGWKSLGLPWKSPKNISSSSSIAGDENHRYLVSSNATNQYGRRLITVRSSSSSPILYNHNVQVMRCGVEDKTEEPITKEEECPLRTIWGALSLGLCQHFPGRPCVYIVVLRDPVERAISNYNYICVQGKENRKGWLPEWRKAGRCPLNLDEFTNLNISSQSILTERLTRGCDSECGGKVALKNLMHPCMRYVLLDRFHDGLEKLSNALGPSMKGVIDKLMITSSRMTKPSYPIRTVHQVNNLQVMENIRRMLSRDIAIYKAAVDNYEQQWNKQLMSCNNL